jgi:hypothetical protein
MQPLTTGLRSNLGTWWVPADRLPAVAHFLHDVLPNEPWDPHFLGQDLATTYFDTASFALRKARACRARYLTLRLRCYTPSRRSGTREDLELYSLSAKTESGKWRREIGPAEADLILAGQMPDWPGVFLPGYLLARLEGLLGEERLQPVVKVCCRRFAVENPVDRYTLDVDVRTDTGQRLPAAVLEFKSTDLDSQPPRALGLLGLRPGKVSKFLWATTT